MAKKILTVLGARPQFIKASVVSNALRNHSGILEVLLHTGQHFDANMSDIFFNELGMAKPDYALGIHGGSHGAMTGRMLIEIDNVLQVEKPDIVLVYGDTNSTLAGAIAGTKLHIPIAHVEAGLRSYNMRMPEEINRILTDRISSWLFSPTSVATENLKRENQIWDAIEEVGDVMFDAALYYGSQSNKFSSILHSLNLEAGSYVLATIHRAENTDNINRLTAIVEGLTSVANKIPVIWPLHPRTHKVLKELSIIDNIKSKIRFIDPVGYIKMIQLEKYSSLIVTDSGGVQKEAYFHKIPCVTLRDETEWVELVHAGWNRLVSPKDPIEIGEAIFSTLGSLGTDINLYGQGNASVRIASRLANDLGL
jgi:UDP-GlcNAc3NAcA epimerase